MPLLSQRCWSERESHRATSHSAFGLRQRATPNGMGSLHRNRFAKLSRRKNEPAWDTSTKMVEGLLKSIASAQGLTVASDLRPFQVSVGLIDGYPSDRQWFAATLALYKSGIRRSSRPAFGRELHPRSSAGSSFCLSRPRRRESPGRPLVPNIASLWKSSRGYLMSEHRTPVSRLPETVAFEVHKMLLPSLASRPNVQLNAIEAHAECLSATPGRRTSNLIVESARGIRFH